MHRHFNRAVSVDRNLGYPNFLSSCALREFSMKVISAKPESLRYRGSAGLQARESVIQNERALAPVAAPTICEFNFQYSFFNSSLFPLQYP